MDIIPVMSKKMRKNSNGDYDIIPDPLLCSLTVVDDDDILCEILSRLPAKSLMRFKCVCKRWQSLIQHNPYFIDLHFNRSKTRPRLFLSSFIRQRIPGRFYLMSADMFDDKALVQCTGLNSLGPYYDIQGPINGLVCLFHGKRVAVRIYNLSTRQMTPWIKRTIKKKELEVERGVKDSSYWFGFDPATKEHKVIFLCGMVCNVLTVGHNSWRRIEEVPPFDFFEGVSVYANGSIYWRKVKTNSWCETMEEPAVLVAFDVGSEKFRMIPVPDFILDQPPKCDLLFSQCSDLLEVDGCVAFLHRMSADTVKLWIFDDDHKKEKITTSNSWIEETITLPFRWEESWGVSFQAVVGTDQIIVLCEKLNQFSSLHSYDRKKKTFKKVEVSGMSVQTLRFCYIFKPFVENLISLQ